MLRFCRQFDADAIELTFAFPQDVFDFSPSQEDIAFLRSKKYVSLHAPFKGVAYGNDSETKRLLSALNSLSLAVGAKNIVFHDNVINDFSHFSGLDFTPLIENLGVKSTTSKTISAKQVSEFLSAHKDFDFCFDVCYVFSHSAEPKDFLVFGKRLKQVHLHFPHASNLEFSKHSLPSKAEKTLLEKTKPVFSLNVPLILEAYNFDSNDADSIVIEVKKELDFLRSLG